MQVRIETELHRRLVRHRGLPHSECEACKAAGCCQHCRPYFEISQRATKARLIEEGRINLAYTWMSVREATDF